MVGRGNATRDRRSAQRRADALNQLIWRGVFDGQTRSQ